MATTDDEVLAALPPDALVAIDAPLVAPEGRGGRDAERLLAWCDVALLPISARRLDAIHGGRRGEALRDRLAARAAVLVETTPEAVLRQLLFERRHGADGEWDLGDYRAAWLGVRPPAYRPKGSGRAKPAGLAAAARLLAGALDLAGWAPADAPDDLAAIEEAARIDALAAAVAARRALDTPERVVTVGTPGAGRLLLPADANLARRLRVNLERMRAGGEVDPRCAVDDGPPRSEPDPRPRS